MTHLSGIFFALLQSGMAAATTAAPDPGCGDPRTVSQAYVVFEADVLDVESSLVVSIARPASAPHGAPTGACTEDRCRIRLVNLEPPAEPAMAEAGRRQLATLALDRTATILISPLQDRAESINAMVEIEGQSMHEALLGAGLARYESFGPYALDGYLECTYQAEEQRARKSRRGMWALPQGGSRAPHRAALHGFRRLQYSDRHALLDGDTCPPRPSASRSCRSRLRSTG